MLQSAVGEVGIRHTGRINRASHKHVEELAAEVGHGTVENLEGSLTRLLCRYAEVYLYLVVETGKEVDTSVLCVFSLVDDAEVGLCVHCLAVIGSNFGRTIDDGGAKLQHLRLGKGFKNKLVSDTVGIAMRYGNAYFSIFHCVYNILCISN